MNQMTIDEIIAAGYTQKSRKNRIVARCIDGGNIHLSEDQIVLSYEEFAEFLTKTGRSTWAPKNYQCPDCETLGHMHRKDCTFNKHNAKTTDNSR